MIQSFQRFSESKVAKVFLIILALSFGAFFGGSHFFLPKDPHRFVAQVGEVEISREEFSRELRREISNLQMRSGETPTKEEQLAAGFPQMVLGRMINQTLLNLETESLNLVVSDDEIRTSIAKIKAFQDEKGLFDINVFKKVLANNGMTEDEFIAQVREEMIHNQLVGAIQAGAFVPESLAAPLFESQYETRKGSIMTLAYGDMPLPAAPDEATLEAFFKAHQDHFVKPETRSFGALVLEKDNMPTAAEGEGDGEGKDAATALYDFTQKLEDELAGGATLEETAKAHNLKLYTVQDMMIGATAPEKALPQDADLSQEIVSTAFDLEDGADSPFNEASSGAYYMVRLNKISPEGKKTFEESKADVLQFWTMTEQAKAAMDKAQGIVSALNAGGTRPKGFKALPPLTLADDKADVPDSIRELVVTLPKGRTGMTLDDKGVHVVTLDAVTPVSSDQKTKNFEAFQETLTGVIANDLVNAYLQSLQMRYPVSVNWKAVESLYGA